MPAPRRPRQLIELIHTSDVLRANPLGDPATREFPVYLPPQYDAEPTRHFAVAWLLTGYTGWGGMKAHKERAWQESLPDQLDRLMTSAGDDAVEPMIVVFPDCFTRFGGSQYRNSPVTGRYEDYLVKELVPFIDKELRTVQLKSQRGVMGKSSGGYGAMIMGMWHPDVFGMVCSTAGDSYFDYCCPGDIGKTFQAFRKAGSGAAFVDAFMAKSKRNGTDIAAMMIIACSQIYSPNPEVPVLFADMPFDLQTGERREDVWRKWLACDPVNMVAHHVAALDSLDLLYLDAGTSDEWCLDIGQRIFADRLKQHGIAHELEEFEGGHMDIDHRIAVSLRKMSASILRTKQSRDESSRDEPRQDG
jgi:S-formylglutathione hydrolase FrmB